MKLSLYWVDAFTDQRFRGNPAAVIPLAAWLPDQAMQQIAFENGLAETAFLVPKHGKNPSEESPTASRYQLRWFTPTVEVDLCGHATLASAFVLFTQLGFSSDVITFDTRSGLLTVARRSGGQLELDFPAMPPRLGVNAASTQAVTEALACRPEWLGESDCDLFAVLSTAAQVRTLVPNFAKVAAAGRRGLIVTAPADGVLEGDRDVDFVSRFFAPQSGIAEDPVTGSAHCALVPYWAARLGKTILHARQVSARGGVLFCELRGNRVGIAGHAVLYLRGEIEI